MAGYQAVVVEWLDILSEDGWAESPAPPLDPVRVTTAGFLLSRDKDKIVIMRDWYHTDGAKHPTFGARISIPASVVQSVTVLKQSKRGR